MCKGSKSRPLPEIFAEEKQTENQFDMNHFNKHSNLLELAASDDLINFIREVENGADVDESGFWYCRKLGSKSMSFQERTPLMIAASYGSITVLKYILEISRADIDRSSISDKVTSLHCAAAGGSFSSIEIVKLLLQARASSSLPDSNGNKPGDLLSITFNNRFQTRKKALESLLKGIQLDHDDVLQESDQSQQGTTQSQHQIHGGEKKEYPVDISLPDINNGVYGTDEFRMYSFKVKPCSRAYSHDWTECPFVHPGENARRRDPRKYPYSCVPCPEFRKGACRQGDACEYAHGVFECWLHPAQYRTRLCKDETNCTRKVCFFAHKTDELRPLYASTGSAIPSPRSLSAGAGDISAMSPLSLSGSSPLLLSTVSTPPISPSAACNSSSPKAWSSKLSSLQLQSSRLKSTLSARDLDLDMELLGLDHTSNQQQHMFLDEISGLSSPSFWNKEYRGETDIFGGVDPSILAQIQGLPMKQKSQVRHNMNQLRSSFPASFSPTRKVSPPMDSGTVAAAVMNSRASAFGRRSQSFVDRGMPNSPPLNTNSIGLMSSNFSDWSSPDGKLDWGIQGEELSKLKKYASFAYRGSGNEGGGRGFMAAATRGGMEDEPDVSWVHSLVKEGGSVRGEGEGGNSGNVGESMVPPWVEQLYIEQEQMVA